MNAINRRIAQELQVAEGQVTAAVDLLDAGSTVPFIARYRKEATGALDDTQLRTLEERLRYLRELEDRRKAMLDSIRSQDKLTPELEKQLLRRGHKGAARRHLSALQAQAPHQGDHRPRGRPWAAGRGPVGHARRSTPARKRPNSSTRPRASKPLKRRWKAPAPFWSKNSRKRPNWSGACARCSGRAAGWCRKCATARAQDGAKYSDYFDFFEPLPKLPSHRILALFRGEKEEILDLTLEPESAAEMEANGERAYEQAIAASFGVAERGRPADKFLVDAVRWAWRTRLKISLAVDMRGKLWQAAEDQAVKVFAGNLRDLLLAAPAGARATLGLDPGFRTGVKVAVVDATGKVLDTGVIYPHEPQRRWDDALAVLGALCMKHKVELIAIGNGTASRETDKLASELVVETAGSEDDEDRRVGSGRLGLFGLGLCAARNCRTST